MTKTKSAKGLKSVGQLLKSYNLDDKGKFITQEFQDYGYRLAMELGDEKHKALYIKLAKEVPRQILEEARIFVKDAYNVRNKARLFMWKLKELRSNSKK